MEVDNSSLAFGSPANGSVNGTSGLIGHVKPASRLELYIVMGILSFLSVMGTAGNALVLYVFSQKKDKLVSTLFIIVLAFVDFITCLIVIPYTIYMEYVEFYIDYDALCKSYQFLITSNIPFSAMIMVAIAIDRYFCICHPFLRALNLFRAKIMIGALALLAAVIGVCVALMYGVYQHVPIAVAALNGTERTTNGAAAGYVHDGVGFAELESGARTVGYHPDATLGTNDSTAGPPVYYQCVVQFTGSCEPNELIINSTFRWYYQKFYTALYLVCLIIVVVLYTLIYRSVLARRTKRQKQKSKSLPLIQMSNERTLDTTTEETLLTAATDTVNGGSKTPPPQQSQQSPPPAGVKNGATSKAAVKARDKEAKEKEKQRRKSMKKDRNRMANLKTAAMLFVVTVVFIVTFCPAFLMANMIIPYNMIVFYMYFANNVANPVIYSFMNKNFRDDLKRLFKC